MKRETLDRNQEPGQNPGPAGTPLVAAPGVQRAPKPIGHLLLGPSEPAAQRPQLVGDRVLIGHGAKR